MSKRRALKKKLDSNHVEDGSIDDIPTKTPKLNETLNPTETEGKNKKNKRQIKAKSPGQVESDAISKDSELSEFKKDITYGDSKGSELLTREPRSTRKKSNPEYTVDTILNMKTVKSKRSFLVRWKGNLNKKDSWELEENLDCTDLINTYLKSTNKTKSKKNNEQKEEEDGDEEEKEKEEEYEVDNIIQVRKKRNGKQEFLIQWKGYTSNDNTWEPEENLNCNDKIKEFLEKQKNSPTKGKKKSPIKLKVITKRKSKKSRR